MADLSGVDDNKQYQVVLLKVVKLEEIALTPATDNVVKGSLLKTFPEDAVDSFAEYVPGPA
jgi:hypothetical protein